MAGTKMLNGNLKWLISLIAIIITLLSIGAWIQSVKGDIKNLKYTQTQKVDREIYDLQIKQIGKDIAEIKGMLKEKP